MRFSDRKERVEQGKFNAFKNLGAATCEDNELSLWVFLNYLAKLNGCRYSVGATAYFFDIAKRQVWHIASIATYGFVDFVQKSTETAWSPMRFFVLCIALLTISKSVWAVHLEDPRHRKSTQICSKIDELAHPDSLPRLVRMGVTNVFKSRNYGPVTIWQPIPTSWYPGSVRNLNALSANEALPKVFLLGDGAPLRAVFGVDQSPGTKLDSILGRLTERVVFEIQKSGDTVHRDSILNFIATRLEDLVDKRWILRTDGTSENPWDPTTKPSRNGWDRFRLMRNRPVEETWYPTREYFPVAPFEHFLTETSSTYCIDKVLLARLLLDRLNIPSYFVAGFTVGHFEENQPKATVGHSWLEIPPVAGSGETLVLDPTKGLLKPKGAAHSFDKSCFDFGGVIRCHNQRYPFLTLFASPR